LLARTVPQYRRKPPPCAAPAPRARVRTLSADCPQTRAALAREIAEAHRGTIALASRPGGGLWVTMVLRARPAS